jgi:hypothetical protein
MRRDNVSRALAFPLLTHLAGDHRGARGAAGGAVRAARARRPRRAHESPRGGLLVARRGARRHRKHRHRCVA